MRQAISRFFCSMYSLHHYVLCPSPPSGAGELWEKRWQFVRSSTLFLTTFNFLLNPFCVLQFPFQTFAEVAVLVYN